MQSIAEMEAICEGRMLAEAEAYMNAQDAEPTARECFEECVHSEACARVFGLICHATVTEAMPEALGCGEECQEYEDARRPMPWGGTMRPGREETRWNTSDARFAAGK